MFSRLNLTVNNQFSNITKYFIGLIRSFQEGFTWLVCNVNFKNTKMLSYANC